MGGWVLAGTACDGTVAACDGTVTAMGDDGCSGPLGPTLTSAFGP